MPGFGRHWVDRPMLPYTGNIDDTKFPVEPEELGTDLLNVEWVPDIAERKADLLAE